MERQLEEMQVNVRTVRDCLDEKNVDDAREWLQLLDSRLETLISIVRKHGE